MTLFPHDEPKFYFFGLRAGMANLFTNGLSLGLRKTVGKITQPINSYTRFPEYYYFERAIRERLTAGGAGGARVLDVGSPKTLGLYLAFTKPAELTLTDYSNLNIDEYRTMWRGLSAKAKGSVVFRLEDARALRFADGEFDIVYSMSVVEHIEGEAGDSKAVEELLRVLKPGGLFAMSVPFGSKYVEQQIIGVVGASRPTRDRKPYFFQRIYDRPNFEQRILKHTGALEQIVLTSVRRERRWLARSFVSLGENIRGMLGFLNPPLSAVVNRAREGMDGAFTVDYGALHRARDIYGDLILVGRKRS